MILRLDLKKIANFIRQADSEDLLDRMTVFSKGMEPAALDLIEGELSRRGIDRIAIVDHWQNRLEAGVIMINEEAVRCSFCDRPAIKQARGWHRLFGKIPLFPRFFNYCPTHNRDKLPD